MEAPRPRASSGLRSGARIKFEKTITVNRPVSEVYAFWRQLENLPLFMTHLASVTSIGDDASHWVAQTDQGRTIEWDARIIEEKLDDLICWESLPGAEIQNAGCVRFAVAPGNRGTIVRLTWSYTPGGGNFGARISTVLNKHVLSSKNQVTVLIIVNLSKTNASVICSHVIVIQMKCD